MEVKADQFVTSTGRRVLTDDGQPGMGGIPAIGSSTEKMQGKVAAAIFANCPALNNDQLDQIINWVQQYKN